MYVRLGHKYLSHFEKCLEANTKIKVVLEPTEEGELVEICPYPSKMLLIFLLPFMLAHKHEQPKTGLAVSLHRHYGMNNLPLFLIMKKRLKVIVIDPESLLLFNL